MKALLEFNWGRNNIIKNIETKDIMNSLSGVFFLNKEKYYFKIDWETNQVIIYLEEKEIIKLDYFNLYFSANLK
jgi:hypothetical protein